MDWILDFLETDPRCFQHDQEGSFLSNSRIRIGFGLHFSEKMLLVVCLTYNYPDSNRSRIGWI